LLVQRTHPWFFVPKVDVSTAANGTSEAICRGNEGSSSVLRTTHRLFSDSFSFFDLWSLAANFLPRVVLLHILPHHCSLHLSLVLLFCLIHPPVVTMADTSAGEAPDLGLLTASQVGRAAAAVSPSDMRTPAASQPVTQAFLQQVRKASRLHSYNLPIHDAADFEKSLQASSDLRATVFQVVKERLRKNSVSIEDLTTTFFSWMLPKNDDEQVAVWEMLINNPIFVSNQELKKIMKLRRSTRTSFPAPAGNTVFYLRCFAYEREQFLDVLNKAYGNAYGTGSHADHLYDAISAVISPNDEPVYMRYVGMTTQGTAWSRHGKFRIPSFCP
jgi:hypothetical protein